MLSRLKKSSLLIWIFTILICLIGLLTVFATTYTIQYSVSTLFYKQLGFMAAGFILALIISITDYRLYNSKLLQASLSIVNLCLLAFVSLYGVAINGAQGWIDLGGFLLQPAELSKLIVAITLSYLLSVKPKIKVDLVFYSLQSISVLASVILVFKQNSLGNSAIITLLIIGIFLFSLKLTLLNYKYYVLFHFPLFFAFFH